MATTKKGLLTAASTFTIALGVGFVMQNGESAQAWYGDAPQQGVVQAAVQGEAQTSVLDVQAIELTAAEDATPDVAVAAGDAEEPVVLALAPAPELTSPDTQDTLDAIPEADAPDADEACAISVDTRTLPGAMVSLDLSAPCLPNERLTVHHSGMLFTETTDADGKLQVLMPAMQSEAVFIVAFAVGDGTVAQAQVDDLDQFDRTVLQWRGANGFGLHALEFGADYETEGHVWAESERDLGGIATGENGFLLQLGDIDAPEPLLAEVYTFPTARAVQAGNIALSVEAEVTQANCGSEIEAQTLERLTDGEIKSQDLTLSVPDCSATGDFLVLNNLVSDLTIAATN